MNCNNLSAADWFKYDLQQIYNLSLTNTCWPWTNIDSQTLIKIVEKEQRSIIFFQLGQLFVLMITPVGLVGSLCSIVSVWRKSVVEKDSFFLWMLLIGIFDFLFYLIHFPIALSYDLFFYNLFQHNYTLTKMMYLLHGPLYALSIASDLCALWLTIERYLGICKPNANFLVTKKRLCKFVIGLSIFLISCIRIGRYSYTYDAVSENEVGNDKLTNVSDKNDKNDIKVYKWKYSYFTKTIYFEILLYVSDVLLPFLLLFSMSYFSSRIGVAMILRRRRKKLSSVASTDGNLQQRERTTSMLRLLSILVCLFILNELGYCIYAIGFLLWNWIRIDFQSNENRLKFWVDMKLYYSIGTFFCFAFESLSRSLNFYLYFCFSTSIRNEFIRMVKKCFRKNALD